MMIKKIVTALYLLEKIEFVAPQILLLRLNLEMQILSKTWEREYYDNKFMLLKNKLLFLLLVCSRKYM